MKNQIVIEHAVMELESNFDKFTFRFEKALGILTPAALQSLEAVPASMVRFLKSTYSENDLMLFNMLVQGDLLQKADSRKMKQYQIGNPHIMRRMIEIDAGAGLYAPLHLLVYEKPTGKVVVEYDLPSSLFAQFKNGDILSDSIIIENKLIKLIQIADEKAGEN